MRHSFLLIPLLLVSLGFWFGGIYHRQLETDYPSEWRKIDSLEERGLYRQAMGKVVEIYGNAKKEHITGEELKALIFKLRYIQVLSEDGYTEIIEELENERNDDRVVFRALKTSMLAEVYSLYYQRNRWSIFKNATYDSPDLAHPETWSSAQFGEYIDGLFQESLIQPQVLGAVKLGEYQNILKDSLLQGNELTMLDLLSKRALAFYELDELDYSTDPLPDFLLDTMLFSPHHDFLDWLDENKDGSSFFSRSLEILGGLIFQHLEDSGESELLASDLRRLSYAYEIYFPQDGDKLYLDALDTLESLSNIDSLKTDIYYNKAQFYYSRTDNYEIHSLDAAKYHDNKRLAVLWARKSIDMCPESRAAIESQNLINRIIAPVLKVGTEMVAIPNRYIPLSLEYANLSEIWYWITPVSPDKTINVGYISGRGKANVFIEGNSPTASGKYNVSDIKDYNLHRVTVDLPPLLEGNYQLILSNSSNPDNENDFISLGYLRVSSLSWITQMQDDGKLLINIVDRGSGNPVAGIRVQQYFRHYDNRSREEELQAGSEFISDKTGQLMISLKESSTNSYGSESFHLLLGSPEYGVFTPERFHLYPNRGKNDPRPSQRIFTDRGIYRPGQSVLFTGLLVIGDKNGLEVDENRALEVYFQDSKFKTLDSLQLRTDDFGYFTGSFTIPVDVLSGRFQIMTSWGLQGIQVEQYKRPGFKINIDPDERVYTPGDSIYIEGQAEAFAGIALKGASVDIEAYMELQGNYSFKHRFAGRKIRVGLTSSKLDDQGRFSWAVKSISFFGSTFSRANYEFRVKVKDKNGETRELSHNVFLSKSPLFASLTGPTNIDRKHSGTWGIIARSPGGRLVKAPLLVRIGPLNKPDIRQLPNPVPNPDTWIIKEKVWEKRFPRIPYHPSNEQDSVSKVFFSKIYEVDVDGLSFSPEISDWGPGRYRIMVSRPDSPEQIIGQFEFDLFDSRRKVFPVRDPIWLATNESEYEPGQTMEYYLGARYPGLYLLEISGKDTIYLKEWISLDNRQIKRRLPISDKMLGNINILLNGVYENNHFSKSQLVRIPWKNKDLKVFGLDSLGSLEPGESADIAVRVVDNLGKPVSIQGVLTIYDSSLDEISPHQWSVFMWPTNRSRIPWRSGGFGLSWSRIRQSPSIPFQQVTSQPELGLNWFGLEYYGIRNYDNLEMAVQPESQRMKAGNANEEAGESDVVFYMKEDLSEIVPRPQTVRFKELSKQVPPPYFREDFRETAHFISTFKTDENGEGIVHFTVPEAITEWKVKVYGHDREMAQALAQSEFQSQKNLMLLPNFPRFVRVGDIIELSVKVAYQGTHSTPVIASFQIENPEDTGHLLTDQTQEFQLLPNDQKTLTWNFEVPEGQHYLRVRLSCSDGSLSDGILADIPVLNRELNFWETKNFMLREPAEILISSGPAAEKAILELNTQPIWLAVQSLPVFTEEGLPCSELWFTRYYTSRLIQKVSLENPTVKDRLLAMAREMESDPRLNNFLKNAEVRRFVLETGIWEGADEEEAIHLQALAESFDPESNAREIEKTLKQLVKLQLPDGSWPWFQGMRPDFRMTLHILGGLGELAEMDNIDHIYNPSADQLINKALGAVDRIVYERYNRQKLSQPEQDPALYDDIIYYLYVRSFFQGINVPDQYLEAYSYYFEKAGKEWLRCSISQQVFIALAYQRAGKAGIPDLVMNSLLERKLDSDGGGIFWKTEPQFRGWYGRDIWQQSRVIEFFNSMPQGRTYIDAMRTWLIQQKRSRDWGDRISTALAVKSLILYGSNWYTSHPSIKIQSKTESFSPLRIDLGTDVSGHYRYTWNEAELDGKGLELLISKSDRQPVWGSLYINKTMDIDTLEAAGSDLRVRRIILIETDHDGQMRWAPISERDIKAGQRIRIRLEVEASQAVDYVQLRDYPPAAFEPDKSLSGYRWGNGAAWYQATGDQFTDFYIPHLPKGFSFFEYMLYAEQTGGFSSGYAEIQSQYATEFMGRSEGSRIRVIKD